MAIATERLRRRILKSGLLSEETLGAHFASLPQDRQPNSAKELAESLIAAGRLTKFQARALVAGETKHLVLGNYVIEDEIGAGGMGRVYLARHKFMNRLVALKTIADTKAESQEVVERFRREVRVAAKLNHANIVTAYDADEANGVLYLTMQYIRGESLSALVRREGSLPTTQAVDFVCQAALGLGYAHQSGIIHRDIKPSNLLLDENSTVKVLDMGLARWSDDTGSSDTSEKSQLTTTGQVLGTADFISPEQARNLGNASETSDVYSLGCTLYWLLTGVPPYPSTTLMEALLAHQLASIPSVLDVRDDISPALDAVITRMLAKEPNHRQQSMDEVIDELHYGVDPYAITVGQSSSVSPELESFFEGIASTAVAAPAEQVAPNAVTVDLHDVETVAPKTVRRERGRALGRRRSVTILFAAALVVAAITLAIITRNGRWQRTVPAGTTQKLDLVHRATLTPETDVVHCMAFSNDGRWLAAGEGSVLRLWDLQDGVGGPPLAEHVGTINVVDFSPDNRYVATGGEDGSVRIWNVATGKQQPSMMTDGPGVRCLSYSPDGKLLAAGLDDGAVAVWELPDTQIRQTLHIADSPTLAIAFSSDGRWLAASGEDRQIRIFDLQSKTIWQRSFPGHTRNVNALAFLRHQDANESEALADLLVSVGSNRDSSEVFVWDHTQDRVVNRLEYRRKIDAIATSASANTILLGANVVDQGHVVQIDASTWDETVLVDAAAYNVIDVAFASNGERAAASLGDGTIRVWDLANERKETVLLGSCLTTRCIEYVPESDLFVSGSDQGCVKFWDAKRGRELWTVPRLHDIDVKAIAHVPQTNSIATADLWGKIVLWNPQTRKREQTLQRKDGGPIYALAASPTQPHLVSAGGHDGGPQLRVWHIESGLPVRDLVGHLGVVSTVSFSSDGKTIASGGDDKKVMLWNAGQVSDKGDIWSVEQENPPKEFSEHSHGVQSVAFSPDGARLASGGADHAIWLRHLKSGKADRLSGHRGEVRHVQFTPDGRHLLSASKDGTIGIWDVVHGKRLQRIDVGDSNPVHYLAIAPDSSSVVSASRDGKIAIWDIQSGDAK